MAKYTVYRVDDPDIGAVYYAEKTNALSHARQVKLVQPICTVFSIQIDTRKFPSPARLYANLLNREDFADYHKDISKEV